MSDGSILFVESNTSGTGALFVRTASRLGYEPIVVCRDRGRYAFLDDSVRVVSADSSSTAELRSVIQALARALRIVAVWSTSEYFIETAASVAQDLGLPGPNPDAIRICRNKARQRAELAGKSEQPAFAHVPAPDAIAAALRTIAPPCIVKPVEGSGSVGVRRCANESEARTHACTLLAQQVNERGMPMTAEVLVEEYVSGPEYSVELFDGEVVGVTRKHLSEEPHFVEIGHDFPAPLAARDRDALERAAVMAVRAMGVDWGPAHVELRLAPRGPVLIEINPRLAGGFIPELVRRAAGVDLIEETLVRAIGLRRAVTPRLDASASIRFVVPPVSGRIAQFLDARPPDDASDVQWYRRLGDEMQIRHDFRDRVGHVIACGPDHATASARAEAARALLSVVIHPC